MNIKHPIVKKEEDALHFNISPDEKNNAIMLQNAINICKKDNINRLNFNKGVYYFEITSPIIIEDMHDFELYAPDARFVFFSPISVTESIVFFMIKNCSSLKFTGFSVDWDWKKAPLASLVQVVQRTDSFVDFRYMEKGEIPDFSVFITTNAVNGETFTPGVENGREYNINGNQAETFTKREKIGDKIYRCYQNMKDLGDMYYKPDTYHLIRHFMYNGGAFTMLNCHDMIFKDVTVYSVPGFGIHITGHSHHFLFDGFKITLPEFEKRYITATADGIHIGQSNGCFLFENCDLGYQGDDCINIHDNIALVTKKESDFSFEILNNGGFLCAEGDIIELRNPDLSPVNFIAEISKIEVRGKRRIVYTKDALPRTLNEGFVVYNRAYNSAHYEIRNCKFHETRARGILAQADDGIIENCLFYKIQGAAIQIESGASPAWSEGTGVNNLIIRNNQMIECDINDWDKGVLYMSTFLPAGIPIKNTKFENPTTTVGDSGADFRTSYPMFKNITIENNLFKEYPRRAMILTSFDGVNVIGNTFENNVPRNFNNQERGSIFVSYGKNLKRENNTFKQSPYMKMPDFEIENCL